MDLDELRSVRRTERQKDSLQHLRDSFYEDVAAYIAERKAERERTADRVDDPYGHPDVRRLTDEIGTAEDVVEAVYERRVGKVVKLASFAAADMSADKSGLTAEERALFDDLVDRIKHNRRTVLDTLAGEDGGATDADGATPGDAGVDLPTDGPPGSGDAGASGSDTAAATPSGVDPDPVEAGTDPSAPGTDAADDPPAPDDVLAAAMGGDDPSESESGTDPDADADADATADPRADARREGPPESVEKSPTRADRTPEGTLADGAETDGGDAAVVAGDGPDPPPAAGSPASHGDGGMASEATGETERTGAADGADDRVTLRITADVGRIYGVDEREYDLESEDVVRLPATNAGPLVDRDAAERLE